ncbi:MAG: tetratricopeptide repeat protein, partial [Candidatus Udaeobacter sp.]
DVYLRGLAFEARSSPSWKAVGFYERAVQLDPNFALAWAQLSRADALLSFIQRESNFAARGDAAKRALENAQKLEPNSPETLLALGYYQYWVLRDYGPAKTTFERVGTMLPSSSEVSRALGRVARRQGHWEESVAYYEQALTLDPRNVEYLRDSAENYAMLRQFPAALKLYDRVLDIAPNDPDMMVAKADIYQAQGNLQEAAKFLSEINEHTPNRGAFWTKINQLRLERNYGEAIRLLQARLAQFNYGSPFNKAYDQVTLAFMQRLVGDTAGAKVTAEQARRTLDKLYRDQPDNALLALKLSQAYAAMGEKDLSLRISERAITLRPRAKDMVNGPGFEENLAFIQVMLGETSSAISTLTELLQTPYDGYLYPWDVTPALLRLDPIWDPLRADPAFQKLCDEKQANYHE